MAPSSTRRPVLSVRNPRPLQSATRSLVEGLERRMLLTINVTVAAGGTLDLNPMSSIFPAGGPYDYMAVLLTTVPGTTKGKMFKINGASETAWGTVGGTTFAPGVNTQNPRVYSGEGFRYVSTPGTAVGVSESIPVRFSNTTGFNQVNDTLVITTVPPANAPTITTQPVAQQSVTKGNRVTLSVAATANGPLTYQWYRGVSPNGFDPIAGATASTYSPPATSTAGSYMYWVKVTNGGLSTNSQTATVFVGSSPVVNGGGPYTVTEAGSVTLNASATDPDNGLYLVYAWDFNGNGIYGEASTAFGDERNNKNAVFNNNFQIDGPGVKTVSLKVTNDKALDTVVPVTINVTNSAPGAMFANDGTAGAVKFYNVVDTAADLATMKYSYDFNNDGTFDLVDSTASNVAVPLAYRDAFLAGQPVRGRVKDGSGAASPDYLTTVNGHVITVTTLADVGSASYAVGTAGVSLRGAIALAESNPDADHILFAPSLLIDPLTKITPILGASLTVPNSAFAVTTPITITGPDGSKGLEIAGKGSGVNYRAFTVYATGSLTLENLNVRDFASVGANPYGGAIYANGPLTVRRSAFYDNTAKGGDGSVIAYGGAIAVENAPVTIDNSTFYRNAAGTATGNFAGRGGAVAALNGSNLTLRHDAISNNTAPAASGVYVFANTVTTVAKINNTIISGNVGSTDYGHVSSANLVVTSGTNNLIGSVSIVGAPFNPAYGIANPGLAAPAQNGGPTMTLAVTPASPAYNAAAAIAGLTTDQRGQARAVGTPDIGAYEVQLAVVTAPAAQAVFPGNTAAFTAAAAGSPPPTVQWQVSTDNGQTFANVAGATLTTLNFAASLSQNNNLYRATFANAEGTVATAAARLTVSGTVTLENGTFAVSRDGATNAITVTGTAGTATYPLAQLVGFVVRNASVTFNSDLGTSNAAAGAVALDVAADANVTFATKQHWSALTLNGSATLTAGGNKVLRVGGLVMGGNATLDLNDNALIYDYVLPLGQMATLRALLAKGRANGAWTGTGLTSTMAKTRAGGNTTLGVMDATAFKAMYGAAAPFAGETVGNAILVKYGLYGDTDFSGTVNFADFVRLQSGFGRPGGTTAGGDFDSDDDVDFADFVLLQSNFGQAL